VEPLFDKLRFDFFNDAKKNSRKCLENFEKCDVLGAF